MFVERVCQFVLFMRTCDNAVQALMLLVVVGLFNVLSASVSFLGSAHYGDQGCCATSRVFRVDCGVGERMTKEATALAPSTLEIIAIAPW